MKSEDERTRERAKLYREESPAFARWAAGYGVIRHRDDTQVRIRRLVMDRVARGGVTAAQLYDRLAAADRIASAALWLVVHMTYARRVYTDGRDLGADDFKRTPEGHTGGALNMVLGYVGYLTANALTGHTRGWMMGQGHCVAAIDAVNTLVGNLSPEQAARYDASDQGMTRLVQDFYSYATDGLGRPTSLLGSHVGPHTAGGLLEGGYLGFAELQYVHVPLPGERLVAFLSDGAFEEQRGSDWAPRWWRQEDCGLVAPIMIANGRRIDQRTTMAQEGGVGWLHAHLALNGFDPIDIDGRDPAAFAWAIVDMEERLEAAGRAVREGRAAYPVPLPYAIAETDKGFGFPGAGTNAAHNLPLGANPATDADARERFNRGARQLWVPPSELTDEIAALATHTHEGRPHERDHTMLRRQVPAAKLPPPSWQDASSGERSPMAAIDDYFCRVVEDNPQLRPRIGNPDELSSNGIHRALRELKHRVTAPEAGVAEAVDGKVITALNEEAVVSAALANKAGINLVVTYEAFGVKMLGALRQELLFSRHQREASFAPQWLAVPVVLTSHTWENGKNEQSHQDPTLCEAMLGELGDVSRVWFPPDANGAAAVMEAVYAARGEIWTLVVPKRPVPGRLSPEQARALVRDGGLRLRGDGGEPLALVAVGAYQLTECTRASDRLRERGVPHSLVYLAEPGRFRAPRDRAEAAACAPRRTREALFPAGQLARVFVCHTRPEVLLGVLRPIDTGERTRSLGYRNQGGTLDTFGMLLANRCTWAHVVAEVAAAMALDVTSLLAADEMSALAGDGDPDVLR